MSSLEKLLKAFESVRVSANQNISKSKKDPSSEPNKDEEKKDSSDQPKTMSYYASSLSQQGQNLLRLVSIFYYCLFN